MSPNNVTLYRERMYLSKQKLSERTGISPTNLLNIEVGRVYPYAGWRKRLAEALNATEEDLFPGMNETTEREGK